MQIDIFTGYTEYDIADINAKNILGKKLISFPERIGHPQYVADYIYKRLLELKDEEYKNVSITTMSKAVVNFIGHLIHKGILDNKNIKIYITMENKEVIEAEYDEEGYLIGWPLGFFNVNVDELIEKYKEKIK